jgi:hypothetical protein
LAHLLRLHPDCQGHYRIPDDFFIFKANKLFEFVRSCTKLWAEWDLGAEYEEHLLQCLGLGLTEFLSRETGASRPVTKTPSVKNLALFFRLFPDACLIIVLRDPHAVVDSMVTGFGNSHADGLRTWAEAADELTAFEGLAFTKERRYAVVRYEALLSNLPGEMTRLLEFAGLDRDRYDFDLALHAPVIGSSMLLDEQRKVTWTPVPKPAGFSPLERSKTWPLRREARLAWLAGRQSTAWGYPLRQSGGGLWTIYNIGCDAIDRFIGWWRHLRSHSDRVAERKRRLSV